MVTPPPCTEINSSELSRGPVHLLSLAIAIAAVLLMAACAARSGPSSLPEIRDYCQLDLAQDEKEVRVLAIYLAQLDGGKLVDRRKCLQLTWVEFTEDVPA